MAVRVWDGDTDTDWATAANWTGDALPVADDEVVFDSRQVTKPTTGMTDGGVGHSGKDTACTFDLLHFKEGYTGGIGTAALPCICSPDTIIIEGTGTYHINVGKNDQSTNTTVGKVIINNSSATVYLYSNCNDGANVAEFTDVYLLAGTLYLAFYSADTDDQGCSVANLYVMPKNNKASNTTVIIEKDAYDVLNSQATNIYMANGTLTTDSQVGTFHIYNGIVNYGTDLGGSPEADLNITLLVMHGGMFNWYPDDSGTPTITTAWLFGKSRFLADATTNDDRAKTITTIYTFGGSIFNIDNNKANITITNWYDYGAAITIGSHGKLALTYDQP
ncbi:hypothetical protein LCGC14_0420890 [marine sediment metagenome]|uniref:G8 domain-containing protein n=1 Tax=marine sediment metagenome TaxID=412755 RepID=A0A0F9T8T7_9ZZZZ